MYLVVFFTYAYRSLLARLRSTTITVLSVGLFVAGATLGLAYYLSLKQQLTTAPPENIIVVSKGAASEAESKLKLDNARKLFVLDGIKREGDQPVAVRELVSRVFVQANDFSRYEDPSTIRGIEERSLAVHHIKMLSGTPPKPGTLEVMVGKRLAQKYPHMKEGYEMGLPGGPGKITGVFSANGAPYEDEVWTDRPALELHINAKTSSAVTLVASDVSRVPALISQINESKDIDLQAATVAEFRADRAGLGTIARTVFILLVLLSVVATFAIATTMNTAVMMRLPELAALAAIGIRKGMLGRIVLIESALLAGIGALVGVGVALLVASQIGRMPVGANPVEISLSPMLLLVALGLGFVVGLLGGVLPALQVRRLDILKALR